MDLCPILNDVLRAEDVTRWHIVKTVRHQSLAEHQYNVAVIAVALAEKLGLDRFKVCYYAMLHDVDEVWTGDIPATSKLQIKATGLDWKKMEHPVEVCLFSEDSYKHVIKAADYIEAMRFIKLNGVGDHAKACADWIAGQFGQFLGNNTDSKFREAALLTMEKTGSETMHMNSPFWKE